MPIYCISVCGSTRSHIPVKVLLWSVCWQLESPLALHPLILYWVHFILTPLLGSSFHPSLFPVSCSCKKTQELKWSIRIAAEKFTDAPFFFDLWFSQLNNELEHTVKVQIKCIFTFIKTLSNENIPDVSMISQSRSLSDILLKKKDSGSAYDLGIPEYLQQSPCKHSYWVL